MRRETLRARGIVLDLDGTLVDSAPTIMAAWHEWAARNHVAIPDLEQALGGRARDTVRQLLGQADEVVVEGLELYEHLERSYSNRTTATAGAREFLESLAPHPWGIVTSSAAGPALARMRSMRFPEPPILVSADDTDRGKPHRDPYIVASSLLELPPAQLIAFEDSDTGITSAHRAGLSVCCIAAHRDHPLSVDVELVVHDFTDLGINGQEGAWLEVFHA